MPTLEELQNDQGFMSASPNDQAKYLSETDPAFKAAHPDDQAAFLAHVTKQKTGAEPYAPAKGVGESLDVAEKHYQETPGIVSGLARSPFGIAIPSMARQAYHAVIDKPKNEEEQTTEDVISDQNPLGRIGGRAGLAAKRMLLDPSVEATAHINEMAEAQRERFKQAGQEVPLRGKVAEYTGKGLSAIPMIGPYALNLGERAGKGDVSGAVTEAAGTALYPEVLKESMPGGALTSVPEGGRAFPTVDAATRTAGTGLRTLGEKAPDIGTLVGGTAGALKGNPASAYFEMKGGHYAGKILGKPLEKLGSKLENVGLTPEDAAVKHLEHEFKKAENDAKVAQAEYDAYAAGREAGVPAPPKVLDAHQKAQTHLQLITEHLRLAREAAEAAKATSPEAAPLTLTPEQEAAQAEKPAPNKEENDTKLRSLMEQIAPTEKTGENVKLPGQVQPETFPQEPTEAPRVEETTRMRPLQGNAGVIMGRKPFQLTEGVPESAPEEPKTTLGEILPPEKKATAAEMKGLKTVDGRVIEVPEKTIAPLVEEGLKKGSAEAKPVAVPPAKSFEEALSRFEKPEEVAPKVAEEVAKPVEVAEEKPTEDQKSIEEALSKHEEKPVVTAELTDEMKRQLEHRIGKSNTDILETPEGVDAARRLIKGTNKQYADMANSLGLKGGSGEEGAWKTEDFKRSRMEHGGDLNPKKEQVINEMRKKLQHDELMEATKNFGPEAGAPVEEAKVAPAVEKSAMVEGKVEPAKAEPVKAEEITPKPEGYEGAVELITKAGKGSTKLLRDEMGISQADAIKMLDRMEAEGIVGPAEGASAREVLSLKGKNQAELKPEQRAGVQEVLAARGQAGGLEGKVGTEEGAKEDTAFFQQARESNPKGSFSDWAKEAQELKSDSNIADRHNTNGGSSVSKKGELKDGYSVGINKSLEHVVDGEKITAKDVKEYRERPTVQKALKENPEAFVGTWVNDGKTYFDTSVHASDLEAAKKLGVENRQKAIFDLKNKESIDLEPKGVHIPGEAESDEEMIRRGVNVPAKPYKDMTPAEQEALAAKGVSGGSQGATKIKGKPMPTEDELIKKYGESSDPGRTAFLLKDGRGVAQSGASVHDEMLGGHATDSPARREVFVNDAGAIRMRVHGALGDREFSMSFPEKGITEKQLSQLQRWAPQFRTGEMRMEVAREDGAYKRIPYGKITPESIENAVRSIVPVLEETESLKPYKDMTPAEQEALAAKGVSGGSQAATAKAVTKLPELAEKHLLPEEKEGVSKSPQQLERFIDVMSNMPKVKEFTDASVRGAGERKWYQRSAQAFNAMSKEAPNYFDQEGDRDKFIGVLASGSPQQSVAMNMREALRVWTTYVDAGRPTGDKLEKLLGQSSFKGGFTLPGAKIPNAMKALAGESLWPDITKNKNFKVPSFRDNLTGMLNRVTNDGWMALFSGLEARDISSAHSYHPISVMTRAAAEELGWEPAEAQAAIWAFIKTLTEKGKGAAEDPYEMRQHSEDFADIILYDQKTRALLKDMGVDHAKLDERLAREVEEKSEPEPSGTRPSAEDSTRRAIKRVEAARGKGAIPPPKTGLLKFGESETAGRGKAGESDEATSFNPEKFKTQTSELKPLGKQKKSPLGRIGKK